MARPNFVEKTFVDGSKTAKFMNVSPSKVFCYVVYALKNMSFASLSVHGETIQYSAVDSGTTSNGKARTIKAIWYIGHISQLYWKQLIQILYSSTR